MSLPGLGGGPTHGPVEPKYVEQINALAHGLDEVLNGEAKGHDRKVGFMLCLFDLTAANDATTPQGRFNYISNADRLDMLGTLKEIVARLEGRLAAEQRGD